MIKALPDLVEFTRRFGELGAHFQDMVLSMPGCSEAKCERLRSSLPNIPQSYLACIEQVNVKGRDLGYFILCPGSLRFNHLAECVIAENDPEENGFAPFALNRHTYIVAANEAEPICLAQCRGDDPGGAVFQMSVAAPEFKLKPLAPDFETLLLLAGNLYSVITQYKNTGGGPLATIAFRAALDHFQITGAALRTWEGAIKDLLPVYKYPRGEPRIVTALTL